MLGLTPAKKHKKVMKIKPTSQFKPLLNMFCPPVGQLTVHYKQGRPGEHFSATYRVLECDGCPAPRRCADEGRCSCPDGSVGFHCEETVCPRECGREAGRGSCDRSYGRCLCGRGWTGPSCDIR